jgi:hypothetical protein
MHAERSMFVAVGRYTADALQFGAQVGMTLVDGDELLRIIVPVAPAPVGADGTHPLLARPIHGGRRQRCRHGHRALQR